jgi:hypothetical protein
MGDEMNPFAAKADAFHTVCQPDVVTEGEAYFQHDTRDWDSDFQGREFTVCHAKLIGAVFCDDNGAETVMDADALTEAFGLERVRECEAESEYKFEEGQ